MREVLLPIGLATGIGSLPHEDPDEAAEFALDRQPRLPAAPSLPRRSPVEGMIPQAAWGIAGVEVLPDGSLLVDESVDRPRSAAHRLGARRRAVRRAPCLPRCRRRSGGAVQGPAHRAGDAGPGPARRRCVPRARLRRGRQGGRGAAPVRWCAAARRAAPGRHHGGVPRRARVDGGARARVPLARRRHARPRVLGAGRRSRGTPSPACTAAAGPTGRPSSRPGPQILSLPVDAGRP